MIPVKAISPTDVAQALLAAWNPSVTGDKGLDTMRGLVEQDTFILRARELER